jgi:hypothetical protein
MAKKKRERCAGCDRPSKLDTHYLCITCAREYNEGRPVEPISDAALRKRGVKPGSFVASHALKDILPYADKDMD